MLAKEEKNKIIEFYTRGVNAKVIAERIGKSHDAVRKYIQRNLKHIKDMHINSRNNDKEILRLTLKECNDVITNNSFKRYNNSIYKSNEKKTGYVINTNVAPIVTFDTPKIIR